MVPGGYAGRSESDEHRGTKKAAVQERAAQVTCRSTVGRVNGDRKMAFLAFARLLDATPAGVPMIAEANDASNKYAGAAPVEPEHAAVVTQKAFVDAVRAGENL